MKKKQAFILGAAITMVSGISISTFANESGNITDKMQSKGVIEFYDEESDSRTIFDANDIIKLAKEADRIGDSINILNEDMNSSLDSIYKKVDLLDGIEDQKLNEMEIEKRFNNILNAVDSFAGKTINSDEAKESKTDYSFIKIPENGYYTKDSYIKIHNDVLTSANEALKETIEKEIVKDLEIHEKRGSLSGQVPCGCSWETSYVGACTIIIGSGRKSYPVWTNTTDRYVKFIPSSVSGDCSLQGMTTVAPGESVYATLSAYVHERPGTGGEWGAYYGVVNKGASGTYSFYLLY